MEGGGRERVMEGGGGEGVMEGGGGEGVMEGGGRGRGNGGVRLLLTCLYSLLLCL